MTLYGSCSAYVKLVNRTLLQQHVNSQLDSLTIETDGCLLQAGSNGHSDVWCPLLWLFATTGWLSRMAV